MLRDRPTDLSVAYEVGSKGTTRERNRRRAIDRPNFGNKTLSLASPHSLAFIMERTNLHAFNMYAQLCVVPNGQVMYRNLRSLIRIPLKRL